MGFARRVGLVSKRQRLLICSSKGRSTCIPNSHARRVHSTTTGRGRGETKTKVGKEKDNILSPRPSTGVGRVPSRRFSGSFNNTSPTNRSVHGGSPPNRRFSLGAQKTGWSSLNPRDITLEY